MSHKVQIELGDAVVFKFLDELHHCIADGGFAAVVVEEFEAWGDAYEGGAVAARTAHFFDFDVFLVFQGELKLGVVEEKVLEESDGVVAIFLGKAHLSEEMQVFLNFGGDGVAGDVSHL